MIDPTVEDIALVERIAACTGANIVARGRSEAGELGGAIYITWVGGREGVVTVFDGDLITALSVAGAVNALHTQGLPVPHHDLVVDLGDRVVTVLERLPADELRPLNRRRVEGIVEVNERFAGAASALVGVPSIVEWFQPGGRSAEEILRPFAALNERTHAVAANIGFLVRSKTHLIDGNDIVHTDLTAANVLFDGTDRATGVVDWNLGVYRGDRRLALVQTRFDREWFAQRTDADPVEADAARRLDEILREKTPPDLLRVHWASWLLHQLPRGARMDDPTVLDWQLAFAEARLR